MIRFLISTLIVIAICVSNVHSQTILWTENFETGTSGVTINTTDVNSSTAADNPWIINDIYAGGSGTFSCLGFNFPFTVPAGPAQPTGITNSPNSQHLHITPQIAIDGGGTLPTASYVTADGTCIFGGTNAFTRMTSDVNTTGQDSVTFNYWWACGGSTLYYGELYYSIDGGTSWSIVTNPNTGTSSWSGQTTWTNTTVSDPIWANQTSLRFGFRFVSGTSATGADLDPGYAVDEIVITGYTLCSPSSSVITASTCSSYTTPSGIVLTSSTTYTDTIPNANGCDSLITINLTIGDATSSLTEVTCNSYITPSGQLLTSSGTFVDTISTFGGCDSVITINLQITTIDTSITLSGMMLSANDTTVGTTYQWIDCATNLPVSGADSASFTPLSNGSYAVVLTQNNCVDTSACEQVVGVGLIQVKENSNWQLYPNPTSGTFTLDFGEPLKVEMLSIYNQLGQVVLENQPTQSQRISIDLDVPNGVYFVSVKTTNGFIRTLKLLKRG